jgi:DNA-binding MarR family transcriptional regulator
VDPSLRLDDQLCFPLYAASRAVTARYRTVLDPFGLTYPQYLVLLVLWEADRDPSASDGPLSVGDIGERLRLDSGTLTPLLKRMEGAGLVRRHRDARDERRVLVRLTPTGRALRTDARRIPEQLLGGLSVDPADLTALRTHLRTLLRALDAQA